MSESSERFLVEITAISPGLADAHRETIEYWLPDPPPLTVAYAELGRRIADDFEKTDHEINEAIFRLVEEGMASNDLDLVTAVATGLIEALIGRAAKDEGRLDRIRAQLLPLSKSHSDAWLNTA